MKNLFVMLLSIMLSNFTIAGDSSSKTEAEHLNILGEKFHFAKGSKRDYNKAREYYLQAVKLGSASAANHLGRLYLNGEGVEKNAQEAEKWYIKSVELDPSLENKCINNQHPNKILCALVLAAMENSAPAQYHLGSLYAVGDTELGKDLDKAFHLFERAAHKGYIEASYAVSGCYREGRGTELNIAKADRWLKKAHAQENRR